MASLLDQDHIRLFQGNWECDIPTILCWADLEVTLRRLTARAELIEPLGWHRRSLSLSKYRDLAETCRCPILRTDIHSEPKCIDQALRWIEHLPDAYHHGST